MGYYTKYKLELGKSHSLSASADWVEKLAYEDNITKIKIYNFLRANRDVYYGLGDNLGDNKYTWYDHEFAMISLSLKFPEILFTLSGEGDEPRDVWIKHFKNGKIQKRYATLVYADYDENKFETWINGTEIR